MICTALIMTLSAVFNKVVSTVAQVTAQAVAAKGEGM